MEAAPDRGARSQTGRAEPIDTYKLTLTHDNVVEVMGRLASREEAERFIEALQAFAALLKPTDKKSAN